MIKRIALLAWTCLLLSGASAQDLLIDYSATNKSLSQVFADLEAQYKVYFAFGTEEVKDKTVSIEAQQVPLLTFLEQLLSGQGLSAEQIKEGFISIKHQDAPIMHLRVVDGPSEEGLPFALAKIKGTYQGFVADENGIFHINTEGHSQDTLQFSFVGYEDIELAFAEYEPAQHGVIRLQSEITSLREVTIKEYINNGITTDQRATKTTVRLSEMEILPGLAEKDVLLTTQILPGITSNDESASGLNIRGSARFNTFYYWNNIPVYHPAHYFGNISSFIPATIDEVDVYKNHIPVAYSGASAGLILAKSDRELNQPAGQQMDLNLTHADLYVETPLLGDEGRIQIGARRSYNDLISTPTFSAISEKLFDGSITQETQEDVNEDFDFSSKLAFSDLNTALLWEPSGRNRYQISAMYSNSVLDYNSVSDDNGDESKQDHQVTNIGLNLGWEHRWGDNWESELSISMASYEMDYALTNLRTADDEADNDFNQRINELRNWEMRFTTDWQINTGQVLQFGYQFNWIDNSITLVEENLFEEDVDERIAARGSINGLFADYTAEIGSRLQLGAAARLHYFSTSEELVADPQVRLAWDLSPSLLIKSSAGLYRQYLTAIQESEFSFSNTIEQHWVLADEDEEVPLIVNRQVVVGFLYDKAGWLVDTDVYLKQQDGLLARNFGPVIDVDDDFSTGLERVKGIDLIIKRKWKNYRIWLSYSFQDSRAELPELGLFNFRSNLNIRHQLQLSQTLNLGQFELSVGYTIRSGSPFTNATGLVLINSPEEDAPVGGFDEDDLPGEDDEDEDPEEPEDPDEEPEEPEDPDDPDDPDEEPFEPFYEITYDEPNSSRLPIYHRLDVSVWYKFGVKKQSRMRGELGISLLNVLNRRNVMSRTFSVDEDELGNPTVFTQQKFFLGFTPNISLRLSF